MKRVKITLGYTLTTLFILAITFLIAVVWGAAVRPFLTVYLWFLYMFKKDDSWVEVSNRIYSIECTLGLWTPITKIPKETEQKL